MVRCKSCGKTVIHTQKGFTWHEDQKCPACYCRDNQLKKVKINRSGRAFELVYVKQNM